MRGIVKFGVKEPLINLKITQANQFFSDQGVLLKV